MMRVPNDLSATIVRNGREYGLLEEPSLAGDIDSYYYRVLNGPDDTLTLEEAFPGEEFELSAE